MRYLSGSLLLFLLNTVFVNAVSGQAQTPRSAIEPQEVLLPVGQSQSFQLLQADGTEGSAGDWLVSDPDVADLEIDGNHVTVTAKTVGHVVLTSTSGAQGADIVVHDGVPPMPQESRWVLQPIDGKFTQALWASWLSGVSAPGGDTLGENTPSYFYEDRGSNGSHIRAVRQDGLQVWQWPDPFSLERPQMICGDSFGGVLVQIGEKESRTLVDLDSAGQERWRYSAPGFTGRDFTYTRTGAFYFLEEHPNMVGGRIVGMDAKEGIRKFAFELPTSQEIVHGLAIRDGNLICSPAAETSTSLPSRHSRMLTNAEGTANLAYSEFSLVAEAPPCVAGSVLVPRQVYVKAKQILVIVDIHDDGTSSTSTVEENIEEGNAEDTWIQASVPTGDIIPGEEGTGNFLAVRRTKQQWRGTGPGSIEEFQYRIGDDRKVMYRFPVPVSPFGAPSTMLLGEDDFGYTTRGKTVIAFNTKTGKEIWRWESTKSAVLAYAALKNDEVMVHEGDGYTILRDGQAVESRSEAYMLFVMKYHPDWQNF